MKSMLSAFAVTLIILAATFMVRHLLSEPGGSPNARLGLEGKDGLMALAYAPVHTAGSPHLLQHQYERRQGLGIDG